MLTYYPPSTPPSPALTAKLGPKPTMLYHLHKTGGRYVVGYKIPVAEGHRPSTAYIPYDQLDTQETKAIASLVADANDNNPDLTKHPWALYGVWKLSAPQGVVVILEWQPASSVPPTVTVGGVTPVGGSSTTMAPAGGSNMTVPTHLRPEGVAGAYVPEHLRLGGVAGAYVPEHLRPRA